MQGVRRRSLEPAPVVLSPSSAPARRDYDVASPPKSPQRLPMLPPPPIQPDTPAAATDGTQRPPAHQAARLATGAAPPEASLPAPQTSHHQAVPADQVHARSYQFLQPLPQLFQAPAIPRRDRRQRFARHLRDLRKRQPRVHPQD